MIRRLLFFLSLLIALNTFSQKVIEGDQMLNLIGRPVTDPIYQEWGKQEWLNTVIYQPHGSTIDPCSSRLIDDRYLAITPVYGQLDLPK